MKYHTEGVFDGIFNDYNSDKVDLLSENESEYDIWSQIGQEHMILTNLTPLDPHPREGLASIRQWVQQLRQRDQLPLTNPL